MIYTEALLGSNSGCVGIDHVRVGRHDCQRGASYLVP